MKWLLSVIRRDAQERCVRAPEPPRGDWQAGLVAAISGLVGAWIASGATGLLAHPLRHALTWLALGCAAIAVAVARRQRALRPLLVLLGALGLSVLMTASTLVPVNILAVSVFLAAAAWTQTCHSRTAILLAAETVTVLGIFYLVRTSLPVAWQAADAVGTLLGRLAGSVTGQPLWVGASFGGLDFLVATVYLAVMAPPRFGCPIGPRRVGEYPMLLALLAIASGHLLYLAGLSLAAPLVASLPEVPLADPARVYNDPPAPSFAGLARSFIPWNLPVLALVIHTSLAGAILHWAWRSARRLTAACPPGQDRRDGAASTPGTDGPQAAAAGRSGESPSGRKSTRAALSCGIVGLAACLPLLLLPSAEVATLHGRKIVLYEKGFVNWLTPQHGQYGRFSSGMYGMLPAYLQSFGARVQISADLSEADLRDADALVLLFPNQPWQAGQRERIWDYVRQGGSLLVMGEHTVREQDGGNRFNDVLEPTRMRVRFDSATFAVGGWLQSYETLGHPTAAGIRDTENDYGVVIGASVATRPPACPLLVGRWGWADPGDVASEAAMMGNGRYDQGEKLGDLVLAAEQRLGQGKIVAFGDTSSLSNGINLGCHPYTSRLLAYLADRDRRAPSGWRQGLGLLAAATLVILLAADPGPVRFVAAAAVLSGVLVCGTVRIHRANELLPEGNRHSPVPLAYVDASHLEAYSRESWREDGTMGLCLTLMRNGYLTLMLPEINADRLRRARLLISIAPARPFTGAERAAILQFIESGGIFLCTVGYERVGPSRELLADLGFRVGATSGNGPETNSAPHALGHFKSPYLVRGDQRAFVRFHAAWPVTCDDARAVVIAQYPPDKATILLRRLGQGSAVVIGDTCFAMNKNLERESGEPFEGLRENADFWRWFLALLEEGAGP